MTVPEKQKANELLDKQLAFKAAHEALTDEELCNWRACQHTFRTFVHYDKLFVAWEYRDGEPHIIGSLRFLEPSIHQETGVDIQVLVKHEGLTSEVSVSHEPVPLFDSRVFCHVPFVITGFYTPHLNTGRLTLRLPVVFKTEAKPWGITEGAHLTAFGEFRSTHEKYKGLMQYDL